MKSWVAKSKNMQKVNTEEIEEMAIQDSEIVEFLAGMQLLEPVPAVYLLPNPDILKPEQMCFFYLDENWISYMIQGALHIGSVSRQEQMCSRAMYKKMHRAGWNRAGTVRSRRLGLVRQNQPEETVRTGFLLRAEAVRCWPGIEVRCRSGSQKENNQKELDILRLDRLSEDTLICIAAGEISTVELAQPEEGIWFEVEKNRERQRKNQGEAGKEGVLDIEAMIQATPEYFAEQMLHRQKRYTFTPKYQ